MPNEFKIKNGLVVDQGGANITGSSFITGSLTVTGGITGSVTNAVSSSYALTASYALNAGSGGGGGALTILDEGISQGTATSLNFVGAGVTATVTSGTASINISGGGGGGSSFPFTGSAVITGSLVVTGSITSIISGARELEVTATGVNLGSSINDRHNVTGSLNITGSVLITGSGVQKLVVAGSGSTQPLFTVQGSQGELFSIVDSLTGSLFSVNDIAGLPVFEAYSDFTVLQGNYNAPQLNTTVKITTTQTGSFVVYSIPTASYDGMFVEYTLRSGSIARAGKVTAMWSGSAASFTDTSIEGFGNSSGVILSAIVTGSNLAVTGSIAVGSGSAWTIKAIVRAI